MPVLLKSGQSASREEAAEEMRDCRSMVHPCHRSTVMPERGPSIISRTTEVQKPHKVTKIPIDDQKPYLCTYILVPGTTMKRKFLGPSKKEPADSRTIPAQRHRSTLLARRQKVEILIAERDDFDLKPTYIKHMLHEDHHFCKIFPYTLAADATHWFNKLPPRSLTTSNDMRDAFLNKFFYDAAVNLEIEMESIRRYMIEGDEQHVYGELS
ncbi:hypothetical protein DY000_02040263 [Brassica cretica]|uniref:Retrotransposon gag domain-containing protein n=1 Tax=Brassica cretica TaxID=69181 RepID=A0ABQ7BGF2_BRACR|nr:hypothetical protein DY000_02040263 [Brassica cretica]